MTDAGPPGRAGRPIPLLAETAAAVWPDARRIEVTRLPRRSAGAEDHLILPRPGAPRWILPAAAPRALAALRAQEQGPVRRTALAVADAGQRAGALRWLPVPRLRVVGAGDSLVTALRTMSGVADDAVVALRLGSWDHARSVVARIVGPAGTTLAFAKAGIDDHGRAAVAGEAHALARLDGLRLSTVRRPEILYRGSWRDLDVLVVSPLLAERTGRNGSTGSTGRRGGAGAPRRLPATAMLELARAAGTRTAPLATSGWRRRTSDRLGALDDATHRERLARGLDLVDRTGAGQEVALGLAHGDWTAWNMEWDGDQVLLWDWEHFGEDVPVGFDHVHYLAQELRVGLGTGPEAEQEWHRRTEDVLARDLGMDAPRRRLLRAAYLVEVNLRYLLDRQGTSAAGVPRSGWGLDLLDRQVASPGG